MVIYGDSSSVYLQYSCIHLLRWSPGTGEGTISCKSCPLKIDHSCGKALLFWWVDTCQSLQFSIAILKYVKICILKYLQVSNDSTWIEIRIPILNHPRVFAFVHTNCQNTTLKFQPGTARHQPSGRLPSPICRRPARTWWNGSHLPTPKGLNHSWAQWPTYDMIYIYIHIYI